jgi:hypothetical protein
MARGMPTSSGGNRMIQKLVDITILTAVSILYCLAVLFLKLRKS